MNFKGFYKKENTLRKILKEAPVHALDYEDWSSSLETGIQQRSQKDSDNDVYLFQRLADIFNITVQQAVNLVKQRLFDILFPENQPNPANTEAEYRDAIFTALTQIIEQLENEHNIRIGGGGSIKTWTARIISNLGNTRKMFNGGLRQALPRQVRQAVDRAAEQISRTSPSQKDSEQNISIIDKLVKKTLQTGVVVPIAITPEVRKRLFNIQDINNPDERELLKAYWNSKEVYKKMSWEGVMTSLSYILPVGPVSMPNMGKYKHTKNIIRQATPYFKFTFDFIKDKGVLTNTTLKFLELIKSRFNLSYKETFIFRDPSSGNFVTRVIGTALEKNKVCYSEETNWSKSKLVPSKKYFMGGQELLYASELKDLLQDKLGGWRRIDALRKLENLGFNL